jgi:circadian clock protein KaiB
MARRSRGPTAAGRAEKELTRRAAARKDERYVLKLYVAGMTPKSSSAIQAITAVCEEHLKGRYDLEVVDICRHPTLARGEQIIAVPTLIKKLPLPLRRLIGSMADAKKLLVGLDIQVKE